MSDLSTTKTPAGAAASVWVTAFLLTAATVAVACGCSLAVCADDTEPLESPLTLSIARQLLRGPHELYGPYGWTNPLVLIHAPLYYHLAALLAWPLSKAGLEPVTAALAAGRSLSFLALAATIAAAVRLARLDGKSPRVGRWAALLIAASPSIGVSPYTVRPDMVGVALQTTGLCLVLSALRAQRPRLITLLAAFVAFGLALCVKQQFVVAPVLSALLLMAASLRGRISSNQVVCAFFTCAAIVLSIYGAEELMTKGEMSQSVFRAALAVSRMHPADSIRALLVVYAILGRSSGLIAILLAASLTCLGTGRGITRATVVTIGTVLLALITLGAIIGALKIRLIGNEHLFALAYLVIAIALVIPVCYLMAPKVLLSERLDRVLWIGLAAELALVFILSRMSTGAWVNYGIQAIVYAGVLIARALDRAIERVQTTGYVVLIVVAASILVIGVLGDVRSIYGRRRSDQSFLKHMFEQLGHPPAERFFFAGRPGQNRVCGRLDLVYDDWLYPVFESLHLAEPRSGWLARALRSESIMYVVTTTDNPTVDGVGTPLRRFGYMPDIKVGPFYVWKHYPLMETR